MIISNPGGYGYDNVIGSFESKTLEDHRPNIILGGLQNGYLQGSNNWVVSVTSEALRVAEIGVGYQNPWINVTPPGWTGVNTNVSFSGDYLLVTYRGEGTFRTLLTELSSSERVWEKGHFEWSVV